MRSTDRSDRPTAPVATQSPSQQTNLKRRGFLLTLGIGSAGAAASKARLLAAFLTVPEKQRLGRINLVIHAADEQVARDRRQERAFERRIELRLTGADGEELIGLGTLGRQEEVRSILDDRSTNRSTVLIPFQRVAARRKKIAGVHLSISKEFE